MQPLKNHLSFFWGRIGTNPSHHPTPKQGSCESVAGQQRTDPIHAPIGAWTSTAYNNPTAVADNPPPFPAEHGRGWVSPTTWGIYLVFFSIRAGGLHPTLSLLACTSPSRMLVTRGFGHEIWCKSRQGNLRHGTKPLENYCISLGLWFLCLCLKC